VGTACSSLGPRGATVRGFFYLPGGGTNLLIWGAMMPEPLLTVTQVAERLNVTPWTVYHRLAYTGKLPYAKIGGVIRFEAADVEA
jgi:excisionase family DNA binding protein